MEWDSTITANSSIMCLQLLHLHLFTALFCGNLVLLLLFFFLISVLPRLASLTLSFRLEIHLLNQFWWIDIKYIVTVFYFLYQYNIRFCLFPFFCFYILSFVRYYPEIWNLVLLVICTGQLLFLVFSTQSSVNIKDTV